MAPDDPVELYLDLMKRVLTNVVYPDEALVPVAPRGFAKRAVARAFARLGLTLARANGSTVAARRDGLENNPRAHTMIGLRRLDNIQRCVMQALDEGVPGDLLEAGVWRGGAVAFMRAILKARGVTDRVVWVADSFQGLPAPDAARYPADRGDTHFTKRWLAVPVEEVKETFRAYGLLDDQVRFIEGFFSESLPRAPIGRLAVARIDVDMYESTTQALESLYPKLSIGGFVILDDWEIIPTCRKAIEDFRARHGIGEPIQAVDGNAGFWRRER